MHLLICFLFLFTAGMGGSRRGGGSSWVPWKKSRDKAPAATSEPAPTRARSSTVDPPQSGRSLPGATSPAATPPVDPQRLYEYAELLRNAGFHVQQVTPHAHVSSPALPSSSSSAHVASPHAHVASSHDPTPSSYPLSHVPDPSSTEKRKG